MGEGIRRKQFSKIKKDANGINNSGIKRESPGNNKFDGMKSMIKSSPAMGVFWLKHLNFMFSIKLDDIFEHQKHCQILNKTNIASKL